MPSQNVDGQKSSNCRGAISCRLTSREHRMKTLEDLFDYSFNKYVFSESFQMPPTLGDLRIFTERLCKEIFYKLTSRKVGTQSCGLENIQGSSRDLKAPENQSNTTTKKNSPIGLESLSKTFNILNIVGRGELFFKTIKHNKCL